MQVITARTHTLHKARQIFQSACGGSTGKGNPKVTLGTFDGVHLGHQAVIEQAASWAIASDSPSVVITFDRRPRETVAGLGPDHITSLRHRLLLMERFQVSHALVLEFDETLAAWEPEQFVERVLLETLNADGVLLGHDTRFGRKGRGDFTLLGKLGTEHGFEVCAVPVVSLDGAPVSSTRVREALKQADLPLAARLLGRPVSALGTVIHGTGRGKSFGIPTANLDLHHEARLPEGVYATRAGVNGEWHDSVTNIGRPPNFEAGNARYLSDTVAIETFLLDFSGDLYGKDIEVRFLKRLRAEQQFDSPEALTEAIASDIEAARPSHLADPNEPRPIV
jgi:riboflavin kinase / FMN adenylyltransferase